MIHGKSISGKFEGYYIAIDPENIGGSDYFVMDWQKIVISDFKLIDDYNSEELKVGKYDYKSLLSNVDLVTDAEHVIKSETLTDVLLKDFTIIRSIKDGNRRMVKVRGNVFGSLPPKVDPAEVTQDSSAIENDEEVIHEDPLFVDTEHTNVNISQPASRSGCRKSLAGNPGNSWYNNKRTWFNRDTSWFNRTRNRFRNSWINSQNRKYASSSGNNGCNSSSGNGGGCFITLLRIFGLLLTLAGIQGLFENGISDIQAWIQLGLGVLMMLASFFPKLRGTLGSLFGLLILIYIIGSLIIEFANLIDVDWWDSDEQQQKTEEEMIWDRDRETQHVSDTLVDESGNVNTVEYFQHDHKWKENEGAKHNGLFRVQKDYFLQSKLKRNDVTVRTNNINEFYRKVYKSLVNEDKNKLNEIVSMYENIGKKYNLNRGQFADMVVTSIQWIPYVLVVETTCNEAMREGGFVTEYLMSGKPCLGGIKFGIQSPVEFMSNFKGDCDTRAVLCFLILDHFGFDVAVLISENYGHSVLGINLNVGGGDYVKYNGKRYYGWETTATGFKAGNMPPDCSNMRYWSVALTNK